MRSCAGSCDPTSAASPKKWALAAAIINMPATVTSPGFFLPCSLEILGPALVVIEQRYLPGLHPFVYSFPFLLPSLQLHTLTAEFARIPCSVWSPGINGRAHDAASFLSSRLVMSRVEIPRSGIAAQTEAHYRLAL